MWSWGDFLRDAGASPHGSITLLDSNTVVVRSLANAMVVRFCAPTLTVRSLVDVRANGVPPVRTNTPPPGTNTGSEMVELILGTKPVRVNTPASGVNTCGITMMG